MVAKNELREAPSPLLEAAAVLLEEADRTLLTTALVKALFYLDLDSLLETGETLTGVPYVALKAGPVVESYQHRLIAPLASNDIAMQDDDDPLYKPIVLLRSVKRKYLSDGHLEAAKRLAKWAKELGSTKLSEVSHENPAWRLAWDDGKGQGREIDMHLAMQQIIAQDPWVATAVTPEEREALEGADARDGNEW